LTKAIKNMKVLIVDDEQVIREALGQKLRTEGFDVVLGADGLEGLRAFHATKPDLVVLDIIMPGNMDGLTVCRRIREVAETPILMLSAQAVTEDDIVEGLQAGADEYLIKPVRLNDAVLRCPPMKANRAITTVISALISTVVMSMSRGAKSTSRRRNLSCWQC
jgi:DNA-binding response OmpR family regulator